MAIAFSRSLRALNNDRFRPSVVVLIITLVLLGAWIGWFFFGSIPLYETSNTFTQGSNGWLAVTFPAQAITQIAADQPVTVQLQEGESHSTSTGTVVQIAPAAGQSSGVVWVMLDADRLLPAALNGQVRVQVGSQSPMAYAVSAVRRSNPSPVPFASTPSP